MKKPANPKKQSQTFLSDVKICFKCGAKKTLDEFYKHPETKDGRLGKCKECTKKDVAQYRKDNLNKIRAHDRERGGRLHNILRREEYAKTEQGRAAGNKAKLNWKKRNPLSTAVSRVVRNAVRNGKTEKSSCEVCGSTDRIHGHHEDYTKPLEINWLCPKHHSKLHRDRRVY